MRRRLVIGAGGAMLALVAVGFLAGPRAEHGVTHVVAVHGAGGEVPSNLLRVYVELSAPMEPGAAYAHIHLLEENGRELHDALLVLREELWSPDHRRLTLLFDPGRVKRGIRANLEMGPPLQAGHRYSLLIDSAWLDAEQHPLRSSYVQELRVTGFDSVSPDPARWSMSAPRLGSRDTLRVEFGEALDHALAARLIAVVDATGARVPGLVRLSGGDRVWAFVPAAPWPPNAQLRVDPALEDLAGNNLARVFDADRRSGARDPESALADTIPRLVSVPLRRCCD